jgi:hypothetical protein
MVTHLFAGVDEAILDSADCRIRSPTLLFRVSSIPARRRPDEVAEICRRGIPPSTYRERGEVGDNFVSPTHLFPLIPSSLEAAVRGRDLP